MLINKPLVVLKYGGGAFTTADGFKRVHDNTLFFYKEKKGVIEVDSAVGAGSDQKKITDLELLVSQQTWDKRIDEALKTLKIIERTHYNLINLLEESLRKGLATSDLEKRFEEQRTFIESFPNEKNWSRERLDDFFAAQGEPLVVNIREAMLKAEGYPVVKIEDPAALGFITDSNFTKASLLPGWEERISARFSDLFKEFPEHIFLVSGFRARDEQGNLTTLGRNFSTYTAGVIAAALPEVVEFRIYSDTEGVHVFDPKLTGDKIQTVLRLSYRELELFGETGAKVVEPNTIRTIKESGRNFPLHLNHYAKPKGPGTKVTLECQDESPVIKGGGIRRVSYRVFEGLSPEQFETINKIIDSYQDARVRDFQTENILGTDKLRAKIEVTLPLADSCFSELYGKPLTDLIQQQVFSGDNSKNSCYLDASTIGLVGEKVGASPGLLSRVYKIISQIKSLDYFQVFSGGDEIDVVVPTLMVEPVTRLLNNQLKRINLVLYGSGKVGIAFLQKVKEHYESLGLNLVGVVDSRGYVTKAGGFSEKEIQTIIGQKQAGLGLGENFGEGIPNFKRDLSLEEVVKRWENKEILKQIYENERGDFVFIDTTASSHLHDTLATALDFGMYIVSANKKPFTVESERHLLKAEKLFQAILNGQVYNRATVGANLGAPDFLLKVLAQKPAHLTIEGCMSGTLAFITSELDKERIFSEVVNEAIEKGYTEPLPYDDLSGDDVYNKLKILWRIIAAHYGLAFNDIEVDHQSFLTKAVEKYEKRTGNKFPLEAIKNLTKRDFEGKKRFINAMELLNPEFQTLREEISKDYVLRYTGEIIYDSSSRKRYSLKIALKPVHKESILGGLCSANNLFIFNSFNLEGRRDRYMTPEGPGAGIEVTAQALYENLETVVHKLRG